MKVTVLVTAKTPITGYVPTGSVEIDLASTLSLEDRQHALTAAVLQADADLRTGIQSDVQALTGETA